MKAALNGVPQLSILDGWWEEGYNGKNGWAVEHDPNAPDPDAADADKIYTLLEHTIRPIYYNMADDGVPHDWVGLMKETIKSTAAPFSARRMVKEYIRKFYSQCIAPSSNP
jgi:starch phosphorylase